MARGRPKTMVIDCPYCRSRVSAKVHGEREYFEPREDPFPHKVAVLSCPGCKNTLVGFSEHIQHQFEDSHWDDATRLWPQPKRHVGLNVPMIVRQSLVEADRCFHAGAYSACEVMCGRALEGICRDSGANTNRLQTDLKHLLDTEVIDKRLYEWGEELRKMRNLGAHASLEKVSEKDARDILDFVHAIADYVFVLSKKFSDFMGRRNSSA